MSVKLRHAPLPRTLAGAYLPAVSGRGAFLTSQLVVVGLLSGSGAVCALLAVRSERRMQRHRRPGVGYAAVTLRRDGGWRRADLFTPEGLRHQRQASAFGITAAALWVLALVALIVLAE